MDRDIEAKPNMEHPELGVGPGSGVSGPPSDLEVVPARAMPKGYLWGEFLVLFIIVPSLYWQRVIAMPLIAGIILLAAICVTLLLFDRTFDRRQMWNFGGLRREWKRILLLFVIFGTGMAAFTWGLDHGLIDRFASAKFSEKWADRDFFFSLPREKTGLWLAILVLYPVFSVYGQELIFRVFLFHRYRTIFTKAWMRIAASAVTFGFVHVIFGASPVLSVVLSAWGGILFAWTYERTRSAAAASFEHALYGDWVWTVGLGMFFYAGALR